VAQTKRGPGRPPGSKNKNTKSTKAASGSRKTAPAEPVKRPATQSRVKEEIGAIVLMAVGLFLILALQTTVAGSVGELFDHILKGMFGFGAYFLPYILITYAVLIFAKIAAPFRVRTVIIVIVLYLMADIINAGRFVVVIKFGILGIADIYRQGTELRNGGIFGMYAGGGFYNLMGIYGLYIFSSAVMIICILLLLNTPISRFFEKARIKREAMAEQKAQRTAEEEQRREEREKRWAEQALEKNRDTAGERNALGSQMEFDYSSHMDRPATVPPRMPRIPEKSDYFENNKSMTPGQKNIMDLMKDDNLFPEDDESADSGDAKGLAGAAAAGAAAGKAVSAAGHSAGKDDTGQEPASAGIVCPKNPGKSVSPPIGLLKDPPRSTGRRGLGNSLNERAVLLEDTLRSFGVAARVVNVIEGPSVTRYEIQPDTGVKVQKIVRLADDIALNLRAKSIRMEAPIPGKAAVGIEVENEHREIVSVKEIIQSREFQSHKSKLAFTVGKDIGGNAVVADLAKMPHMLIAGATGSGKSVCINTIIASILYKARPEEVKLVLVDPKMVELGNYNGIPHLLIPVVTDASKAATALNWAVGEMTGRYKKFAAEGVRDINGYNKVMKTRHHKDEMLPQIVVIIDELADLMMVASSQVEDAICRLAQLARGAGMHLIVATQRPSVDVITGLIKANIPSRIAFMVSSQIDSRTIIDMPGAEKLVGNGDMLFKPQNLNKPKRIQAPFISDGEVKNVIDFVKGQVEGDVEYAGEVIEHIERGGIPEAADDSDDLYDDAVECVVMSGHASVSMLQRRFRIGYNRAARIIDIMEARGIVGPADGSKPRTVLLTEEEFRSGGKE